MLFKGPDVYSAQGLNMSLILNCIIEIFDKNHDGVP